MPSGTVLHFAGGPVAGIVAVGGLFARQSVVLAGSVQGDELSNKLRDTLSRWLHSVAHRV